MIDFRDELIKMISNKKKQIEAAKQVPYSELLEYYEIQLKAMKDLLKRCMIKEIELKLR